jgi:hypothetical protein
MMPTIYKTGGMNMTYRDRQRLRAAQARRTAPAEAKWPETIEELDALGSPGTQAQATASSGAEARARLVQNAQQTLQALQAQQAQRRQLAAQKAGGLQQNLMSSPYLSLAGLAAPGQSTRTQQAAYSDPAPEPGPPPDYGQQTPQPTPTPQPNQTQGASGSPGYGMIDPGVAIAQQIMEKRNKDLQSWGQTAATASALGLPVPPLPPMPGGQAQGNQGQVKTPSIGFADPGLHAAIMDEQLRSGNQYRLNPERLVSLAKSQVGYTEKNDAQYNNDDISDATHKGSGNYSKYGAYTGNDGAAWCASFISWLAHEENESSSFGKWASTGYIMNEYGDDYHANDHVTPPHAGDLVIFHDPGKPVKDDKGNFVYNSDGSRKLGIEHSHIGIVVAYDPKTGTVYTVEGNTGGVDGCGGCVNYHSYNLYDVYKGGETDKRYMQGFCSNGGSSFGAITNAMK